ncbi:hypothetical protein VDGL01_08711 [Verticillium dahliae]
MNRARAANALVAHSRPEAENLALCTDKQSGDICRSKSTVKSMVAQRKVDHDQMELVISPRLCATSQTPMRLPSVMCEPVGSVEVASRHLISWLVGRCSDLQVLPTNGLLASLDRASHPRHTPEKGKGGPLLGDQGFLDLGPCQDLGHWDTGGSSSGGAAR